MKPVLAWFGVLFIICSAGAEELKKSWRSAVNAEVTARINAFELRISKNDVVVMNPFLVEAQKSRSQNDYGKLIRDLDIRWSEKHRSSSGPSDRPLEDFLPGLSAFFDDVTILGRDVATRYKGGHPVELFGQKGTIRVSGNLLFTPRRQPFDRLRLSYGIVRMKAMLPSAKGFGISAKF